MSKWKEIGLGEIATFHNGYPFKPTDWSTTGKEIIRIQNLTKGSSQTNYFEGKLSNKYSVTKGDILISWSGSLGIYEWEKEDAWLNQHLFKVVFDKEDVDKSFFKYLIINSLEKLETQVHGATMKHITKKNFDAFPINLPPLPQQEKIANILDAADALRQNDKALIAKYDELTQSLFLDMFGDPVSNPKGWEKVELGNIAKKITDGEHQNPSISDTGKHLIMAKDVLDDKVDFSNPRFVSYEDYNKYISKCKPEYGDIVLVSRGATVGRCTVVSTDIPFCLMGSVILIKKGDSFKSEFVISLLKNKRFLTQLTNVSSASAQQAIYISHLKKLKITLPPLDLQNQFAERVTAIEAQKAIAQASLAKSEELFNSLLQKAFKGELV